MTGNGIPEIPRPELIIVAGPVHDMQAEIHVAAAFLYALRESEDLFPHGTSGGYVEDMSPTPEWGDPDRDVTRPGATVDGWWTLQQLTHALRAAASAAEVIAVTQQRGEGQASAHEGHRILEEPTMSSLATGLIPRTCTTCNVDLKPREEPHA